MKRPIWMLAIMVTVLLITAACSGPPPTQVFIVLSPTHQPPTLTALAGDGQPAAVTTTPEPGESASPAADAAAGTPAAGTPTAGTPAGFPTAMPTARPLPTALVSQIQVAEQAFEHGRMFWLQPSNEIWVLIESDESTARGEWLRFEDTFVEGEIELDAELTPPADREQPRRGFGKLWRTNDDLRQALGWGVQPEFGFVTTYEYRPGGYLNATGEYIPAPGIHILTSSGNQAYAFEEADETWRLVE